MRVRIWRGVSLVGAKSLGREIAVPSLWPQPGGVFKSTGMGVSRQLDAEQLNFRRESRGMKKMGKSSEAMKIRVRNVGLSGCQNGNPG